MFISSQRLSAGDDLMRINVISIHFVKSNRKVLRIDYAPIRNLSADAKVHSAVRTDHRKDKASSVHRRHGVIDS